MQLAQMFIMRVSIAEKVLKFFWGQRSRSGRDSHENLENSMALEPLNGFEPKLIKNTCYTWETNTVKVFKVMEPKVKVTVRSQAEAYRLTVRRAPLC